MAIGKSRRETEVELARISPQSVPRREEIRPINDSENKMTLIITDELLKKIERLKEVLPQGHGNSIADIIDKSVSIALRKFDPLLKKETKERGKPQSRHQSLRPQPQPQPQPKNPTSSNETRSKKRPYIPVSIIKELHITNQSRCSFISRTTGKRCNETHSLQIEHVVPFAKGGPSHRTNLTLLCPAHQRVRALEEYGKLKCIDISLAHSKQKYSPLPKKERAVLSVFWSPRTRPGLRRQLRRESVPRASPERPECAPCTTGPVRGAPQPVDPVTREPESQKNRIRLVQST